MNPLDKSLCVTTDAKTPVLIHEISTSVRAPPQRAA